MTILPLLADLVWRTSPNAVIAAPGIELMKYEPCRLERKSDLYSMQDDVYTVKCVDKVRTNLHADSVDIRIANHWLELRKTAMVTPSLLYEAETTVLTVFNVW
jgi:hypothetical protein